MGIITLIGGDDEVSVTTRISHSEAPWGAGYGAPHGRLISAQPEPLGLIHIDAHTDTVRARLGAVRRPQRSPQQTGSVSGFCIGARGA